MSTQVAPDRREILAPYSSLRMKGWTMFGKAILSLIVAGAIVAVVVFVMSATGQYKK